MRRLSDSSGNQRPSLGRSITVFRNLGGEEAAEAPR